MVAYIIGLYWIIILNKKSVVFFENKWYNYINKKISERKKRSSEKKFRKSKVHSVSNNHNTTSSNRTDNNAINHYP